MIDATQFLTHIIRPTLKHLDLHSTAVEMLLLGTAIQESRLGTYLRQIGGGPALGVYQMEPAPHADIWTNFLGNRPDLAARVTSFVAPWADRLTNLVTNCAYATALARIHYFRVRAPLPAARDLTGLAAYWKDHYGIAAGRGTPADGAALRRKSWRSDPMLISLSFLAGVALAGACWCSCSRSWVSLWLFLPCSVWG
ncbi:MAG: hypothetical protein FD153_90 [Rhodospirillaceae bacterium]|nr:MAG: hypothetical protein FD153_90 [Rhodospirillaceae bacterium]